MEFCIKCQTEVPTFYNETTTIPQNVENKTRKYCETFCANCGTCIKTETQDYENGKPVERKN